MPVKYHKNEQSMEDIDRYLQHSSTIWPVWLNDWVFVFKLSGCGFEYRCNRLRAFLENVHTSDKKECEKVLSFLKNSSVLFNSWIKLQHFSTWWANNKFTSMTKEVQMKYYTQKLSHSFLELFTALLLGFSEQFFKPNIYSWIF